ncbi:hypothetical protein AZE42_09932 [Rhizopogon vesiculosus]|uniref:Transmembrane protein n=1 Tax=Rhizopogon vesiculosus TaxID=180088 RepID=A0A1J8QFT1_9AGAM|nr:hypothetical protein AZE42_09932 [Rhizopogon vesiculosus]
MASLPFLLLLSILPCILAVQVHPVARSISSNATCTTDNVYAWMNDEQGNSPCLTVAYVEAACIGNSYYLQPSLMVNYSYSLPNSTTANACYCSWSSYNLMMACTLCQGSEFSTSVWTQVIHLMLSKLLIISLIDGLSGQVGAPLTLLGQPSLYFPSGSGYVLSEGASIPVWATLNPANWTSETFNVINAQEVYQQNPSDIVPNASSTSSSTSSSGSSSKSPDVGAIVGGTVGAAAFIALLAIGAYLVYRRRVYNNAYASVTRQQGTGYIDRGDGTTTRMTHSRFGSETSSHFALGQSMSPSQQYTVYSPQPQTVYPSLQGSFSPPPRTDTSVYTTHGGQTSNAIPLV